MYLQYHIFFISSIKDKYGLFVAYIYIYMHVDIKRYSAFTLQGYMYIVSPQKKNKYLRRQENGYRIMRIAEWQNGETYRIYITHIISEYEFTIQH